MTIETPSSYQSAILTELHALAPGESIVVDAGAGCGKSATLRWVAGEVGMVGNYIAFGSDIAKEQAPVYKGTRVAPKTAHSFGLAALTQEFGRLATDKRKCAKMARQTVIDLARGKSALVDGDYITLTGTLKDLWDAIYPASLAGKVADKARLTHADLNTLEGIEALLGRFNMEPRWYSQIISARDRAMGRGQHWLVDRYNGLSSVMYGNPRRWAKIRAKFLMTLAALVRQTIADSLAAIYTDRVVDFVEMIYAPVALNLSIPTLPWILVDESQDLSPAILELLMCAQGPETRMVFVGDPIQAIYGFAGAATDSIDKIIARTEAKVLSLPISYRCPTKVAEMVAATWKPAFQARPGAPDGSIREVAPSDFTKEVSNSALVLCRLTRPLVDACWSLLKANRPAYVAGKALGDGIMALADEISGIPGFRWDQFDRSAAAYTAKERNRILKATDDDVEDERLIKLLDEIESATLVWSVDQPEDRDAYIATLTRLLDAGVGNPDAIRLMTAHRCKGLQSDEVWILEPETMPFLPGGKEITAEQMEQEEHLMYVAATRTKFSLNFCGKAWDCAKPWLDGAEDNENASYFAADDEEEAEDLYDFSMGLDEPQLWTTLPPEYSEKSLHLCEVEGCRVLVRVHGAMCRIEVYEDEALPAMEGTWVSQSHRLLDVHGEAIRVPVLMEALNELREVLS